MDTLITVINTGTTPAYIDDAGVVHIGVAGDILEEHQLEILRLALEARLVAKIGRPDEILEVIHSRSSGSAD